jgi:hypothetical protein
MKVVAGGGYTFCAVRDGGLIAYPIALPSDKRVLAQMQNRRPRP